MMIAIFMFVMCVLLLGVFLALYSVTGINPFGVLGVVVAVLLVFYAIGNAFDGDGEKSNGKSYGSISPPSHIESAERNDGKPTKLVL